MEDVERQDRQDSVRLHRSQPPRQEPTASQRREIGDLAFDLATALVKRSLTGGVLPAPMFSLLSMFTRRGWASESQTSSDATFYRSLAEQAVDVIAHVDADGCVTYISPAVSALLGTPADQWIGQDILRTVVPEDLPAMRALITKMVSGEIAESTTQVRCLRPDRTIIWVETTAKRSAANDGSAVIVMRDISVRKSLEEELAQFALQDGLTGLGNRRSFDQTLEREWSRTVREQGEMSLLLIDVDCFKQFNDEYGHVAGDDCLRSIANAIRSGLRRPADAAYRYGGEEMAVILGSTGRDGAVETAERVRSAVAALGIPHVHGASAQVVTVSIGAAIAVAREGGSIRMPEGLLQAADHALYRAKNGGRNRVFESLVFAPGHGAG